MEISNSLETAMILSMSGIPVSVFHLRQLVKIHLVSLPISLVIYPPAYEAFLIFLQISYLSSVKLIDVKILLNNLTHTVRFPLTVAYGMCSVPSHIPYPSASLRERSYASVALQPLPAASTFPFPANLLFLKIFFSMR